MSIFESREHPYNGDCFWALELNDLDLGNERKSKGWNGILNHQRKCLPYLQMRFVPMEWNCISDLHNFAARSIQNDDRYSNSKCISFTEHNSNMNALQNNKLGIS